jgi:hypothetical protein
LLAGIAPQAKITASKLAGDKAAASCRTPKRFAPTKFQVQSLGQCILNNSNLLVSERQSANR